MLQSCISMCRRAAALIFFRAIALIKSGAATYMRGWRLGQVRLPVVGTC